MLSNLSVPCQCLAGSRHTNRSHGKASDEAGICSRSMTIELMLRLRKTDSQDMMSMYVAERKKETNKYPSYTSFTEHTSIEASVYQCWLINCYLLCRLIPHVISEVMLSHDIFNFSSSLPFRTSNQEF